ncbi:MULTISPECIES: glycosyltransferase [Halomonadaceae]|uniref:glycosyltransferase n=1 Tax=Halomonadaceae TaxID=28256 RepID=UPI00158389F1|nr:MULTISPECIES: glycosyltransferase [Halomonas]MDI4637446.1 glycosyltransferase [Halomonas sp. BMC7]NUJ61280.1 glycosyltransferase [Halomonas taeanensis]
MDELLQHASRLAEQAASPLRAPIEKRIAYVVSHGQSYASNGYAIRTQGIAQALNQHGFETLCFVRPGRPWELGTGQGSVAPETKVEGVHYLHSRWLPGQAPANEHERLEASVERFVKLFRVYRPAVVLAASNYIVGLPAWIAAKRLGLPFYNEVRGFWELSRAARESGYANTPAFKQEAERDAFVARQALKVFTLNQPMKEELARRDVDPARVEIVPNGVSELPEIRPANPALKQKLGIQDGDKVMGYMGSFTAYEGLETLIEACEQLVKQGEKLKLLLVGDDQPVTEAASVSQRLADKPWLIQVGRIPHERVADYYALIDTVVIPRKQLPVCELVPPIKAAEALAYGKQLVVSNVAPLVKYAQQHDGVVTFDVDKAKSLAKASHKALRLSGPKEGADVLFSAHTGLMAKALSGETVEPGFSEVPCQSNFEADTVHVVTDDELIKTEAKGLTQYEFPAYGKRLVFNFETRSKTPYAHEKVIAGIEIQDEDGIPLESESYRLLSYGKSSQYSQYKYLSTSCDGVKYALTIEVPINAWRCVVKLGSRRGAEISVLRMLSMRFYSGGIGCEIAGAFAGNHAFETPESVGQVLGSLRFNVSHVTDVVRAMSSLSLTNKVIPAAFWYMWRVTNDPFMFEMARQRLVFQGRMYETKQLLDEWDEKAYFRNGKNSSRRLEDDILLLENGMPLPEKRSEPEYEPNNNVLYLLHNRLPYNSGGYATRTHGLLTGVVKNSNFKMHGVSRPGYPSDHAKHISKPLPKMIPSVDLVDGIEYFALDQKVRRSSLTTTEYIEEYAKEVETLARNKQASIIHAAANFPNGLAASLAARRLGIKSVYEVRGLWEITRLSRQEGWDQTDQFRFMAKMEAEACNAADAVITITEALKELMVSRGVDASKITVAPNCVHTELFSPLDKDRELAKELGVSEKDIVIGYIGSIVNYEGLDDLLGALALLVKDGVTNFKFLLVGDGAVLDSLKHQVVSLGLQNYVIITGRVPHKEVQRYYSLVDITPFPRKPYLVCEAVSPLKPFEAMASQKAVIVSSCAALTEIIQDGYNGVVFEKGDVFSLRDALKQLIRDDDLRERLAINGRNWVVKERDWSFSSGELKEVYESLLYSF